MKKIICTLKQDEDISLIVKGQAEKFLEDFVIVEIDKENPKESLLVGLSDIEDDKVIFVPPSNILLEAVNEEYLKTIDSFMDSNSLDYVRLRRIGVHRGRVISSENDSIWEDTGNLFFLVPHMIKTDVLKTIIEKVKTRRIELFWNSIETGGYKGGVYYMSKDQKDRNLSYWRSGIFHTISDVVNFQGKWSENYVDYNDGPIKTLLAEYNIDVEQRGVGSAGGCCV